MNWILTEKCTAIAMGPQNNKVGMRRENKNNDELRKIYCVKFGNI